MRRTLGKAALVVGVLLSPIAAQPLGSTSWVKDGGVLYGNADTCTSPASVSFKKVMKAIPEIETIRTQNPSKARRDILINKANKRLKKALKAAAEAGPYDCIVKKSAISGTPPKRVTDITKELIRRVKK